MKFFLTVFMFLIIGCVNSYYKPNLDDLRRSQQLIDRGVLYLRNNDAQNAMANFEVALELDYSAEALDGIGATYFLMGDYKQAQNYFLKAYNENNSYAPALEHLALLYELFHYNEEAEILYNQALALEPKLYSARNNKAIFQYENKILGKSELKSEILKAQAIFGHKVINENLKRLGD